MATPSSPQSAGLLYRHTGAINVLSASPNGEWIALAGGGTIDRNRRKHDIFKEHFKVVVEGEIALFRRDDLLAAMPVETTEAAAEPSNIAPALTLKGHTGEVRAVRWQNDATLWTSGGDRFVRRWDLAKAPLKGSVELESAQSEGAESGAWRLHHDAVLDVLPPFGESTIFHSVGADRWLRRISTETGEEEDRLELGKHLPTAAVFLDDATLVVANARGEAFVVNLPSFSTSHSESYDEPIYSLLSSQGGEGSSTGVGFWSGDRTGRVRKHLPTGEASWETRVADAEARILTLAEDLSDSTVVAGNIRGEIYRAKRTSESWNNLRFEPLAQIPHRATASLIIGNQLLIGDHKGGLHRLDI